MDINNNEDLENFMLSDNSNGIIVNNIETSNDLISFNVSKNLILGGNYVLVKTEQYLHP
jgi:hypothetical protein